MSGGINQLFSIARTGLIASQRAVEAAGNNISNANTPGYSRQRVDLVNGDPVQLANYEAGTGVRVAGIDRVRDSLLDASVRNASASGTGFGQKLFLLEGVEASLSEPGNSGLGAALDRFWGAWGDLANDPSSSSARLAVRATGEQVAASFHRIDNAISSAKTSGAERLNISVNELNQLSAEVAELNREIQGAEAGGGQAPALRDRRDLALDRMSEIAGVEIISRSDGTVAAHLNGRVVVDGGTARPLSVTVTGGVYAVETASGPINAPGNGGIGTLLQVLNTDLPALESDLDQLANAVVTEVNTLHNTGTNPNGNTGVDFFDPVGVTAGSINIGAVIAGDAQEIAAGTPDGGGLYQAGENDVALGLADLRNASVATLGGATITASYGDYVSDLGLSVFDARQGQEAQDALKFQAEIRRSEVSGVSIDEEMIDLIRFQQSYTAAARMVTTADEMLQTIVNMV